MLQLFKLMLVMVILAGAMRLGADRQRSSLPVGRGEHFVNASEGRQYFVAPTGKVTNPGTKDAPWDLASALGGLHPVAPGDTIWVRGGSYQGKFEVKLTGQAGAPIHIRAYPGERATLLDSGLTMIEPTSYVWLWDLEIAGSVPVEKRQTQQTGSFPTDLPGHGGLDIHAGQGCKCIHLVIHDNVGNGVGWWVGSTDSELYGCLIYNNGWRAPDRGHGHCIYTQNKDGLKTVSNCIMSVPYKGSFTMHAYGSSKAYVDNYLLEDNVAYERGPFLVGGGRPSHHIKVLRNYLYGVDMRIGYGAENEDCEVRVNVIAGGVLTIEKYKAVVERGNIRQLPARKTILLPSKYEPDRAHLVIYNGAMAPEVAVNVTSFLKPGDRFRLLDPQDVYGRPRLEGQCQGKTIQVPMKAEFAVFVVVTCSPG